MASRRKEEAVTKAIVALPFLLVFGWIFSPAFRALVMQVIYIVLALAIACGVLLIAKWLIKRKRDTGTSFPEGSTFYDVTPVGTVAGSRHQQPAAPKAAMVPSLTREYLLSRLRQIDWFQFEKLMALLYVDSGYAVCRMGGAKADGGVDLLVEKEEEGKKGVVQCKHWRTWKVTVKEVRELLGAMTDHGISNGVLVTVKGFTADANEFAGRHGIVLYDEADLVGMILGSSPEIETKIMDLLHDERKFCPRCERIMTLRTAKRGANSGRQFWGCSAYPACKYIFNLDDSDKNAPSAV